MFYVHGTSGETRVGGKRVGLACAVGTGDQAGAAPVGRPVNTQRRAASLSAGRPSAADPPGAHRSLARP